VVFENSSSGGDRRKGPCIGLLAKEKGNDKSFKYLYSEMVKDYDYRILTKKQSAIRQDLRLKILHTTKNLGVSHQATIFSSSLLSTDKQETNRRMPTPPWNYSRSRDRKNTSRGVPPVGDPGVFLSPQNQIQHA
jgi:hypothetical protein